MLLRLSIALIFFSTLIFMVIQVDKDYKKQQANTSQSVDNALLASSDIPDSNDELTAHSDQKINLALNINSFLETYCHECHGPEKEKGDIRFDTMNLAITDEYSAETWQEVLDTLNLAEMPPRKASKHPTTKEMALAINELTNNLQKASKHFTDTTKPVIRRINRREYVNTMMDIFNTPVNPVTLPDDDYYEGFDTVGQAHTMSLTVFEQYRTTGKDAIKKWWTQILQEVPYRMTRQGLQKQEYTTHVRREFDRESLKSTQVNLVKGLKFLNDGKGKDKEEFDEHLKKAKKHLYQAALHRNVVGAHTGHFLIFSKMQPFPTAPGKYKVTLKFGYTNELPDEPRYINVSHSDDRREPNFINQIARFQVKKPMSEPHIISFEVQRKTANLGEQINISLGTRSSHDKDLKIRAKDIDRVLDQLGPNSIFDENTVFPKEMTKLTTSHVWVDYIDIERIEEVKNPELKELEEGLIQLNTLSDKDQISQNEKSLASNLLSSFIHLSLRGKKPTTRYQQNLYNFYLLCRADKMSARESIVETFALVLASPSFVYHTEENAQDTNDPKLITQIELANRLSYTLWGSAPDDKLLALSKSQQLSKPEVFHAEVERLLNDKKSHRFVNSFTRQWLELDHLDMVVVDKKFKNYNNAVQQALKKETIEFMNQLIKEDLSLANIIDSNFVIVDDLLANFYGLKIDDDGDKFQKVTLPKDSVRGGLLGQGSILTMTSDGQRTSPIHRGVFVLKKLLGTEPPPPPPNVPQLEVANNLSVREKLAMHSESAQCSSCHMRFDPYGLVLENFDPIGQWRDSYKPESKNDEHILDVSAELSNGQKIKGNEDLKKYLSSQSDRIAEGVMKSMMVYSLGRPVGFSDEYEIERMMNEWKNKDFGMRSLVHLIVSSDAFKNK